MYAAREKRDGAGVHTSDSIPEVTVCLAVVKTCLPCHRAGRVRKPWLSMAKARQASP
jgi:hypothetical protein